MKGNLFSSYLKSYFQTIQIKEDFSSLLEDHSSENWLSSNILIKYRIAGGRMLFNFKKLSDMILVYLHFGDLRRTNYGAVDKIFFGVLHNFRPPHLCYTSLYVVDILMQILLYNLKFNKFLSLPLHEYKMQKCLKTNSKRIDNNLIIFRKVFFSLK